MKFTANIDSSSQIEELHTLMFVVDKFGLAMVYNANHNKLVVDAGVWYELLEAAEHFGWNGEVKVEELPEDIYLRACFRNEKDDPESPDSPEAAGQEHQYYPKNWCGPCMDNSLFIIDDAGQMADALESLPYRIAENDLLFPLIFLCEDLVTRLIAPSKKAIQAIIHFCRTDDQIVRFLNQTIYCKDLKPSKEHMNASLGSLKMSLDSSEIRFVNGRIIDQMIVARRKIS